MSALKILIVSDLHVGRPEDANITTRLTVATPDKPVCDNPIGALSQFIAERKLSFDLMVNLGDITNKGYVPGWNMGIRMLSSLANNIGCPLLSTPGNHDYCFDFDGGAVDLLKRTNDYPTNNTEVNVCFWGKGFSVYTMPNMQILILNSGNYLHNSDDLEICPNYENFCDSSDLAQYLDQHDYKGPRIAIVHHHVAQHSDMVGKYTSNDVIDHADQLLELLETKHFSCVIHGHKHIPRFTTYGNLGILACGSLSCLENIRTSDEDNYFHIMTIVSDNGNIRGKIETFHYILQKGWFPIEDSNAHVKSIYGFGTQIDVADLGDRLIARINDKAPVLSIAMDKNPTEFPELPFLSNDGLDKLEQFVTSRGYNFFQKSPKIIIYK